MKSEQRKASSVSNIKLISKTLENVWKLLRIYRTKMTKLEVLHLQGKGKECVLLCSWLSPKREQNKWKKIDAIFEIKMVKLINRYKLYLNDEIHDLCVARGSGRRAEFFWLLVNKRSIGLESQLSTIDQKAILVYYPSD